MPTLRQLREDLALTQTELGKMLGVTKQTIWGWESGNVYPYPGHIRKLAEIFGKSVPEIRAALQASKEATENENTPDVVLV